MLLDGLAPLSIYAIISVYFGVGVWMCLIKGWPLRGGLSTGVIAMIPLVCERMFIDSDALGYAFLTVPLMRTSILISTIGLLYNAVRLYRK